MTHPRPRLEPGPDHPITVAPFAGRVTVRAGSATVAETTRALELREGGYPPVLYVPLDDVDRSVLRPGPQHTYCPYKGEASYFDVVAEGAGGAAGAEGLAGAVWHYPEPFPAVAAIRGHVAFYADRVAVTAEPSPSPAPG